MNLMHNPELVDRLAASYALGTLRYGARRRFESLARAYPAIRFACNTWQTRLSGMTEFQRSVEPPQHVWTKIQNLLPSTRVIASQPERKRGTWWQQAWRTPQLIWKVGTAVGALATVAAVTVNVYRAQELEQSTAQQIAAVEAKAQAQLQAHNEALKQLEARLTEQPKVLAVLSDKGATPVMLVTVDKVAGGLVLQRLTAFKEADDRSLQLWALPQGGRPRSLGVLNPEQVMRVAASLADLQSVPAIAISLEPKGGVPSEGGPTGPVLFSGPLIAGVS